MTVKSQTLDHLVTRAGELYTLPAVAVQVLQLTRDPHVDALRLKQCIENDPALAIRLLKIVNSSLYGLTQEVSDLNQALTLLGVKPLKLLVLGFSLPTGLFADVARNSLARYWTRTLTKAVAARELALKVWKIDGDEAFIASLLQNLGHLVLIKELGTPYVRLVERVCAEQANLATLEREALGFVHPELTAALLRFWGLPESIVLAVQAPESLKRSDPANAPQRVLLQIVHLAQLITELLLEDRDGALEELLEVGQAYHGLTAEQVSAVVDGVQSKVEQLAAVMLQKLPEDLNYKDVLERARRQLAEMSAEVTVEFLRAQRELTAAKATSLALSDEVRQLRSAAAQYDLTKRRLPPRAEALPGVAELAAEGQLPHLGPQAGDDRRHAQAAACSAPVLDAEADDDPALLGRLRGATVACRQSRQPLSLLLFEVDRHVDLAFHYGLERSELMLEQVRHMGAEVDHQGAVCQQVRDARYAVVLPGCDRQEAVQLGNQLLAKVRRLTLDAMQGGPPPLTISLGIASVALPPKNFFAERLSESAARCLYGAQTSGGNSLKSIEIY